jgi:hypothetical protein
MVIIILEADSQHLYDPETSVKSNRTQCELISTDWSYVTLTRSNSTWLQSEVTLLFLLPLLCFQEVSGSNTDPEFGYPNYYFTTSIMFLDIIDRLVLT